MKTDVQSHYPHLDSSRRYLSVREYQKSYLHSHMSHEKSCISAQ